MTSSSASKPSWYSKEKQFLKSFNKNDACTRCIDLKGKKIPEQWSEIHGDEFQDNLQPP